MASPTERRWFDRLLAHPRLAGAGAIASLIAIPLAVLLAAGVISFGTDSVPLLRLGQPGVSGPLTITPLTVECGKHVGDVKERPVRAMLAPRVSGQLCFVRLRVYDSSHEETSPTGASRLGANGNTYSALANEPEALPVLFPGSEQVVTVIYDLPAEVVPNRFSIRSLVPFNEPPTYGATIYYDIEGAVRMTTGRP